MSSSRPGCRAILTERNVGPGDGLTRLAGHPSTPRPDISHTVPGTSPVRKALDAIDFSGKMWMF